MVAWIRMLKRLQGQRFGSGLVVDATGSGYLQMLPYYYELTEMILITTGRTLASFVAVMFHTVEVCGAQHCFK